MNAPNFDHHRDKVASSTRNGPNSPAPVSFPTVGSPTEWTALAVMVLDAIVQLEPFVSHTDSRCMNAAETARMRTVLEVSRALLATDRRFPTMIGAPTNSSTTARHVPEPPEAEWLAALTPAERRVALAVGGGRTDREAAKDLYLSSRTVSYHLRSVFRKLGVRTRGELAHLVGRMDAHKALAS